MLIRSESRRAGFTLVEVLVAAGLCMLIMAVMATAFQTGMDTLSHLKSIGDLQQRLRTADIILRRDLVADHLESKYGGRVSDQRMDLWQPMAADGRWEPPAKGFFRVIQEVEGDPTANGPPFSYTSPTTAQPVFGSPSQLEGLDPDGAPSTRAVRHILQMTVKLPATRADEMFHARVPKGAFDEQSPNPLSVYRLLQLSDQRLVDGPTLALARNAAIAATTPMSLPTRWAEVSYFLDTANPTATTTSGLRTYTLYRKVRPLAETDPVNEPRPDDTPAATGNPRRMPAPSSIASNPAPAGIDACDWRTLKADFPGLSSRPFYNTRMLRHDAGRDADILMDAMPHRQMVNGPGSISNPHNRLGGVLGVRDRVAAALPAALPTGGLADVRATDGSLVDGIGPTREATGTGRTGDDVLLTNVLSFEIKLNWDVNPSLAGMGFAVPPPGQQPDLAFGNVVTPASIPELIFDDLPVPTVVAGGVRMPGQPQTDPNPIPAPAGTGNPLFARKVFDPAAPPTPRSPNGQYRLVPVQGDSYFSRRRVFDTWHKFQPFADVARLDQSTGAGYAAYRSVFAPKDKADRALPREAYNDVVGTNLINAGQISPFALLGRWDEPFVPYVANPVDQTTTPGIVSPQRPSGVAPNPNFVPLPIRVKAIQIKIRLWDPKNQTARQITIVESL